MPIHGRLESLSAGQVIPFGGDRFTEVSAELAEAFGPGDRLIVVQETGDLLHIPKSVATLVTQRVDAALSGFAALSSVSHAVVSDFYERFAALLEDDASFEPIADANKRDVELAASRGRSTTRLELSTKMRADMVSALRMWRDIPDGRGAVDEVVHHSDWTVEARRAPSGVVGFVFEGRPNVFADATGVLRSGNAVVFRIGSDALGTARSMMEHALRPALVSSGMPVDCVQLVDSTERSAGHALFDDRRLALAVARGSGPAVAQLGSVARQSGVPVSLHGTGGAWMIVDGDVPLDRLSDTVESSLDRKVCNTVNVVCLPDNAEIVRSVLDGVTRAASHRSATGIVHAVGQRAIDLVQSVEVDGVSVIPESEESILAVEWEWENDPELSIVIVESVDAAVDLFNTHSPQFIVSVLSDSQQQVDAVYSRANAPFVGDGFTRWVDGQYALGRPELGLSNWQGGRLFARGGILSGDSVYTVRYVAHHTNPRQRR